MLEKLVSRIFCSEIPYDELINVVYLFCSDLLMFSQKTRKIVHVANRYKMVDIKGPSISTRTSLLKCAEASSLFFFLCISMGDIGKLLKPKTRSFHQNLNSRRVFKNHQYFMVSKSNFRAFFKDKLSLCGITPNHLRSRDYLDNLLLEIYVVISGNSLLFKDIKFSLGLLITARKMPCSTSRCQQLQII